MLRLNIEKAKNLEFFVKYAVCLMFDFDEIEPHLTQAARTLHMMSNPARLKLLCVLSEGETSVGSIVEATAMPQPTVSQHLRQLREAGLIESRRQGQMVYNRLKGDAVTQIMDVLYELYCKPTMMDNRDAL